MITAQTKMKQYCIVDSNKNSATDEQLKLEKASDLIVITVNDVALEVIPVTDADGKTSIK